MRAIHDKVHINPKAPARNVAQHTHSQKRYYVADHRALLLGDLRKICKITLAENIPSLIVCHTLAEYFSLFTFHFSSPFKLLQLFSFSEQLQFIWLETMYIIILTYLSSGKCHSRKKQAPANSLLISRKTLISSMI